MASLFFPGRWYGVKNHYLGFEFEINRKVHYGWARMSVNSFTCYGCIGQIEGYAYETVPNKPIRAGDEGGPDEASVAPASLGMLALGAPGFNARRQDPRQE